MGWVFIMNVYTEMMVVIVILCVVFFIIVYAGTIYCCILYFYDIFFGETEGSSLYCGQLNFHIHIWSFVCVHNLVAVKKLLKSS